MPENIKMRQNAGKGIVITDKQPITNKDGIMLTFSSDADVVRFYEMLGEFIKENIKPKPENVLIEEMDLSNRTYSCLKRYGIRTLKDITRKTEDEIWRIRSLGSKSFAELTNKLEGYGVAFRNDD